MVELWALFFFQAAHGHRVPCVAGVQTCALPVSLTRATPPIVTRWQVYDWRRRLRQGRLALPESMAPMFAPLMVEEVSAPQRTMRPPKSTPAKVEIVIDGIVIRTAVDLEYLPQVIRAVRASR